MTLLPGSYSEDWKLIFEQVMMSTYPLADGSGRRMGMKLTLCDSGGKEGVTANAYDFVRWLRYGDNEEMLDTEEGDYDWQPGMAGRFLLVKGEPKKGAPRIKVSYPDSQRKDRNAGARGEIPVAFLHSDLLKDMVDNRLDRKDRGGRFYFPDWLDDNFYIELTVEVKDAQKGWINPKKYHNESFDLLAYAIAGTISPIINIDYMDFTDAPDWAEEWDDNSLVFDPAKEEKAFDPKPKKRHKLEDLGKDLG